MAKLKFKAKSGKLVQFKNFLKSAKFTYTIIILEAIIIGVLYARCI